MAQSPLAHAQQPPPLNRDDAVVAWLLEGDPAIQYQTWRDLLGDERPDLQARIATEGWGARFLLRQNADGSWGNGFYQPKWTSSHYTLLDLRALCAPRSIQSIRGAVTEIARTNKATDGGINPVGTVKVSDVCINGMFLRYACYFRIEAELLVSVVDYILEQGMPDGGFNCRKTRGGARHSSLHSTISVLEGIHDYLENGYVYRAEELSTAAARAREFVLIHRLYNSDHTGEVIHPELTRLVFPPRWKFNILRALDYFRAAGVSYDARMDDAIQLLMKKRRTDGRWPLQAAHPGAVHFKMEEGGGPSRWNTLLALRVLGCIHNLVADQEVTS